LVGRSRDRTIYVYPPHRVISPDMMS
jgi:hypothetical protein